MISAPALIRADRQSRAPYRRALSIDPPATTVQKSYLQPSVGFAVRGAVAILGMLVGLVALLPIAAALGHWWLYVLIIPLLGAASYKVTVLMHECAHRTLFRNRRVNRSLGHLCGALVATRFVPFAKAHWQHHLLCGSDDDSGDNDYLTLQHAPPARLVRHLLTPLTGVTFARTLLAREKDEEAQPAHQTPADRPPFLDALPSLILIVATQASLAWLATGFGRWWALALVYPATGATLGLFFSRVRAFCEHVSAHRQPGECSVRTHVPNWFDRCFFYTLNMNFHVEHHLYPQIPACHLPAVHRDLVRGGYFGPTTLSHSILGTIRRCLADARL